MTKPRNQSADSALTNALVDQADSYPDPIQASRRLIRPRQIITLAVLLILVAAGWLLREYGFVDPSLLQRLVDQHATLAPAVFLVVYAACVVTALPTLPFNLAAGLFWGPWMGGLLSSTATTIGATAAFVLGRLAFGAPLAGRFDNRLVNEFQRELATKGWRFIAFLRLNPTPTGPLNYVLALTSIRFSTYVWATFVFLIPPSITVALIGHSLKTFLVSGDLASGLRTALIISVAVTIIVALGYLAYLFNRVRRNDEP